MYNSSLLKKAVLIGSGLITLTIIACIFFYLLYISAPASTVYPVSITVESGQTVSGITKELKKVGLVKSDRLALHILLSEKKPIQAGVYVFNYPMTLFGVTKRIAESDFGYVPVRVTVPEGTNSKKLAQIINSKFPYIATSTFEELARQKEGYLFPETYFFPPEVSADEIIQRMESMFKRKIAPVTEKIQSSGKSLHEVLTLASILEEEVRTAEDMSRVADLLERRIEIGMPLQVDATIAYYTGKTSAEMSLRDLRTDNPYNSYTRKGLPPTPISNPGIQAIQAVLNPTPNEYLFYLSDKDGITRFSKTHDEHVRLKQIYLR